MASTRPAIARIALVALPIAAVAICLAVGGAADRRWKAAMERTRRLREEAAARPAARPVLRGEATDGNAWDDYGAALETLQASARDAMTLQEILNRGPRADRAAVAAFVERDRTAIDKMREGTRRAEAQYAYAWGRGLTFRTPDLLKCQTLSSLAACRARLDREAGRPREAAELALDVLQFTRDLGHNGILVTEFMAHAASRPALDELQEILVSRELSREELAEVARELEILDLSLPRHAWSLLNERMILGQEVRAGGGGAGTGPFSGIRAAISGRLATVAMLEVQDRHAGTVERLDEVPWSAVEAYSAALDKVDKMPCDLPATSAAKPGRERRAMLRLLRMAAHYRATGEVLDLEDPFGARLRHERNGAKLRVWSVGPDGTDHGGDGGWHAPLGRDILLEVER